MHRCDSGFPILSSDLKRKIYKRFSADDYGVGNNQINQTFTFKESFTCEEEGNDRISGQSGGDGLVVTYTVLETPKHMLNGKWVVGESKKRTLYSHVDFVESHECTGVGSSKEDGSGETSLTDEEKEKKNVNITAPGGNIQIEVRGGIFGE